MCGEEFVWLSFQLHCTASLQQYRKQRKCGQARLVKLAAPTTVACSIGSYDIFNLAGFKPDFVAGHSLGELSALYAAGALKRDEVCKLVWHRSQAMATNTEGSGNGGMAAVIGDGALNISITVPGVWIANRNLRARL